MSKEIINIDSSKCIGCGSCVSDCLRKRLLLVDEKCIVNEEIPCIECGHCIAICPVNAFTMNGYDNKEVIEYTPEKFDISSENLLNFIKYRRSIRQFKDDAVNDEVIRRVIEAGRFTPTAANRQNVSYIILKDRLPEMREMSLKVLYDIASNNPDDNAVSNLGVYRSKWISNYEGYVHSNIDRMFFDAPAVLLVIGSSISSGWVELNAGLASSSIGLMLNTEGLGSCYIGFFGIAAEICPDINKTLGIGDDEAIVATLAVGYPKVKFKRTALRKPARIDIF
jgi:nitroreductase/NAD-dependent dihydropyrimidine dehydrogenase PreA subunit